MKQQTEERVTRVVGLVLVIATMTIYFASHFMNIINEPPAWEIGIVFLVGIFFVVEPEGAAKLVGGVLRSAVKYLKRFLNLDE